MDACLSALSALLLCMPAAGDRVVDLSAAGDHTCALMKSGRVACWGANDFGQLGDGSTEDRSRPVRVLGVKSAVEIATGIRTTCARTRDGRVLCWGMCYDGQCGHDGASRSPRAQIISGLDDAVDVASGDDYGCAVRSGGAVACWGASPNEEEGHTDARPVPGIRQAVAIEAQDDTACVLTKDGRTVCWGQRLWNYLEGGSDATYSDKPVPPEEVRVLRGASQLSMDWTNACALTSAGGLRCFGEFDKDATPKIQGGPLAQVRVGLFASCVRTKAGQVHCWGERIPAPGGGIRESRDEALAVQGVEGAVDLAVGTEHGCVLLGDGQVRCWGNGEHGQRGSGGTLVHLRPVRVEGVENIVQVNADVHSTCALDRQGRVWCWGSQSCAAKSPRQIELTAPALRFGGESVVCALPDRAPRACWLITGVDHLETRELTDIPVPDTISYASGDDHECAVTRDGRVRCWGDNQFGQLVIRNEDRDREKSTVEIPGIRDAVQVACGDHFTCARTWKGAVHCWGIMDGTFEVQPLRRIPGVVADELVAGETFACVRTRAGAVKCFGQWGIEAGFGKGMQPRDAAGMHGIKGLSAYYHTLCGLRRGGVVCMGYENLGRLGDGPPREHHRPVRMAIPGRVTQVDVSFHASCAVTEKGRVWCWGSNDHGQAGDGYRFWCGLPARVAF